MPVDPNAPAVFAEDAPSLMLPLDAGPNASQQTSEPSQESGAGASDAHVIFPVPPLSIPTELPPASQPQQFVEISPLPINSLGASSSGTLHADGGYPLAVAPLQQPRSEPSHSLSGHPLRLLPAIGHIHPPNQVLEGGNRNCLHTKNVFPLTIPQHLETQINGYPTPYTMSEEESWLLHILAALCKQNRAAWCNLVGLYFMESEVHPNKILAKRNRNLVQEWEPDLHAQDLCDRRPELQAQRWRTENAHQDTKEAYDHIWGNVVRAKLLGKAIGLWAEDLSNDTDLVEILRRAGWTNVDSCKTEAFWKIDSVLKMPEGANRNSLMQLAQEESPKFWKKALSHWTIGQ